MKLFDELVTVVHRLRAPGGCPWDRAQTHQTLRPHVIEEAYEVLEVLDKIDSPEKLKDPKVKADLCEELGDLLMQVVLHSEMTAESKDFTIEDVVRGLTEKLIRRHPHVFGEESANGAEAALASWEKQKAKEKAEKNANAAPSSVLDGLPHSLPALQRTTRLIEKVSKVGFQWPDLRGPLDKLREELSEFEKAAENAKDEGKFNSPEMQDELGDILFSVCNVAHFLKLQPEDALRSTLQKFERRFRFVEGALKERGKSPDQSDLNEMDSLWNEAKAKGL